MKLFIKDLAKVTDGRIVGDCGGDLFVQSVIIDSRTVCSYKTCLFVALKGPRHDGHDYIKDMYRKGVRYFLIAGKDHFKSLPGACFVIVEDSLDAIQELAGWHRRKFCIPVLAITGSNGKTVVKEWLFDLLKSAELVVRSPGSYNSQVGVPLSVLKMNKRDSLGIFEAGISRRHEMKRLADILRPSEGIITNIGDAHQENFSSLEEKATEKLKLFASCRLIVYCRDSFIVEDLLRRQKDRSGEQHVRLFAWSFKVPEADLYLQCKDNGSSTTIHYRARGEEGEIIVPFSDAASLEDVGHCLAYLIATGRLSKAMAVHFGDLQPLAMRLEIKEGINGCVLINDYYNSDMNSLEIALQFLSRQPSPHDSRRTLILSDFQESGYSDEELILELTGLMTMHGIDRFIGIGPWLLSHRSSFPDYSDFYERTSDFVAAVSDCKFENCLILLKGARIFHFEQLSSVLQRKAHQTRMEINLTVLVENLNAYKSLLQPDTKIVAMVKAFSYGSGTIEIARALEIQGIDYLAVAVADEGVDLRRAGIRTPVIVMNPEPHCYELMIANRLEPNIYSLEELKGFKLVAGRMAEMDYPVHLKLDTGMHRLGFSTEYQLAEVIRELNGSDVLQVQSVFSHLAVSDDPAQDDFTRLQFRRFDRLCSFVRQRYPHPVIRHILNSAGIERFPDYQMEMVRLGIGLYGVSLAGKACVRPVASWKTVVSQIKEVEAGETVGYGRRGIVDRPKTIAVIPVGYADGYSRRLGNGVAKVGIGDRLAPVIGNVCMDMTMIDVTGIPLNAGDEVELMGNHIPLVRLAEWEGTIPYEVLTSISGRVKRIYLQE